MPRLHVEWGLSPPHPHCSVTVAFYSSGDLQVPQAFQGYPDAYFGGTCSQGTSEADLELAEGRHFLFLAGEAGRKESCFPASCKGSCEEGQEQVLMMEPRHLHCGAENPERCSQGLENGSQNRA